MSPKRQQKISISRLSGACAIGERLRNARKSKGLTLDLLAEKSDIGKGTLVAYEKGQIEPSALKLIKIARVLGISIVDLVMEVPGVREESPAYGDPGAAELLAAWGGMSSEGQRQMLDFVRFLVEKEKIGKKAKK